MRIDYEIPDNINLMGFAFPEDNNFGDDSSHSEDELSLSNIKEKSHST